MPSPYDFHIHTTYLKCANETMSVPALVRRCESLGLEAIAITDHLNEPSNLPLHMQIRQDLRDIRSDMRIYFGVEVNVIDKGTGAVSIDEAQIRKLGCELVIGGPHASYFTEPDREGIIDLQHRLMLDVIANPLVDVLVHPWWFGAGEFQPGGPMAWFTSMGQIPDWHGREIAEAALAYGTAIEANYAAFFTENQYGQYGPAFRESYVEYLAGIAQRGVRISIGSDAHDISWLAGVHEIMALLEGVGVGREQFWTPEMRRAR